jgi:hypothetical protein
MNIGELWQRIISTRYASTLEAEVARLRAENRALLNSILGIAGVPPLPAMAVDVAASQINGANNNDPQVPAAGAVTSSAQLTPRSRARAVDPVPGPHIAVPMRKRSWQQITRMLEFESAQKEKPTADAATSRATARNTG